MKDPFAWPCCGSRDKKEVPKFSRAAQLVRGLSRISLTNAVECGDLPNLEAFGTVEHEEEVEESDVSSVNTEDRQEIEEARAMMNKEMIARGGRPSARKKNEVKLVLATSDASAAVENTSSQPAPPTARLCSMTSFPDSSANSTSAVEGSISLTDGSQGFRTAYSRVSRRIEGFRRSLPQMNDGDPQELVHAVKERIAKSLREEEQTNDTMTQVEREAITLKINQLQEEEGTI